MYQRILLCLFVYFPLQLCAQEYTSDITKYTIADGLSHNQANWVLKDARGVLWVGAANGINRFDGKEFKFVAEFDLFQNRSKPIEDSEGDLWFYTNSRKSKLAIFNTVTEKVKSVSEKFGSNHPFINKEFKQAEILRNGSIVILTLDGTLFLYDKEKGFKSIYAKKANMRLGKSYLHATSDGQHFWVYHPMSEESSHKIDLRYFNEEGAIENSFHLIQDKPNANCIVAGNNLLLFSDIGLYEITPDGTHKRQIFSDYLPWLPDRIYASMAEAHFDDSTNHFVFATSKAIFIGDKKSAAPIFNGHEESELNITQYFGVYTDKITSYWLASMDGLIHLQLKPTYFHKVLHRNPSAFSQTEFVSCRGFCEMDNGEVLFNTRSGLFQLGEKEAVGETAGQLGLSILVDSNFIWASSGQKLVQINTQNYECINEGQISNVSQFKSAWSMYKSEDGRLWFTQNGQLFFMGRDQNRITQFENFNDFQFLKKNYLIYSFYTDQKGLLWLCTNRGLFRLDLKDGIVEGFWEDGNEKQYLPAKDFRHMYQDQDGIYWLASTRGLVRWDKENGKYKLFDTKDGFSNTILHSVYEDDYGFLWVSSDNGIMQFEKESHQVKIYLPSDGTTHREFNRISHLQATDGTIYFGSVNGVTYFHPKDFYQDFHEQPDVPITLMACQLFSGKHNKQESKISDYYKEGKIIMAPEDKYLQLQFALLAYENTTGIEYQYMINSNGERTNNNWIKTKENSLTISALPYGNHQLAIKGLTANGTFSKQELLIPITVLKPFYLEWWFIILVALLLVGLISFFQKRKTRTLLKRQEDLEKTVEERTKTIQIQSEKLKEIDKAKSRFLANISHELRTPLTLILNSLDDENAIKIFGHPQGKNVNLFHEKDVDIVRRNAKRLEGLVGQLLDLSTLESGQMKLKASENDFYVYVKELTNSFVPLANKKNIDLSFSSAVDQVDLFFDRDKMDKILYNVLANAIKFSHDGGYINVRMSVTSQEVCLEIEDNGVGVPKEDLPEIFNRFYQAKRKDKYAYEGTGLGLALVKDFVTLHYGKVEVESELEKGTLVRLHFPLGQNHLNSEEILNSIKEDEFAPRFKIGEEEVSFDENSIVSIDEKEERPLLLIIEDNEDLLYHQQRSFGETYQLLFAKDGQQGIKLAIEHIPDLVLCDVMMPVMDGYEVCRKLKSNQHTNHIPIILLTAKASHDAKLEGLTHGADDYLTKPYNQQELALRIKNQLDHVRIIQERYRATASIGSKETKVEQSQDPFVLKVIKLLEENISDSYFGVAELSQALKLSRSQLFRKLKAITGETPAIFIRKHRLKKARLLLEEDKGNASEVSYMVGFSSPNYFYKCFKKEYGVTPTELMTLPR